MTRADIISHARAAVVTGGSFLFLLALAPASPAVAQQQVLGDTSATLNIAPLRFEFEGEERAATVRLTNASERVLAVQTRLFAWSQENGEDQYAPSSELAISPSIVSIPPGETQIVRLVRKSAPSQGEKRFRLAIDQLPDPTLARNGEAEARLRFTLPVFLDRGSAAPADFAWRLTQDRVELRNAGGQTSRITGIEVKTADGRVIPVERNTLRYIHGGAGITWPIGGGCGLGRVTITAQIDGQAVDAEPAIICS